MELGWKDGIIYVSSIFFDSHLKDINNYINNLIRRLMNSKKGDKKSMTEDEKEYQRKKHHYELTLKWKKEHPEAVKIHTERIKEKQRVKVECTLCHRKVSKSRLKRHQTTKLCKKISENGYKNAYEHRQIAIECDKCHKMITRQHLKQHQTRRRCIP